MWLWWHQCHAALWMIGQQWHQVVKFCNNPPQNVDFIECGIMVCMGFVYLRTFIIYTRLLKMCLFFQTQSRAQSRQVTSTQLWLWSSPRPCLPVPSQGALACVIHVWVATDWEPAGYSRRWASLSLSACCKQSFSWIPRFQTGWAALAARGE